MNRLIMLLGLALFISCQNQSNKIHGVWIFDKKTNIYDSLSIDYRYPIIYDFEENGEFILKNYGSKHDTIFNWDFKSDTILTIEDSDYFVQIFNEDSITLIDYSKADTVWITLKKAKKSYLNYSKDEIENILLSNIWLAEDTLSKNRERYFEFFNNKTVIYRYNTFDNNLNDTIDVLQLERWGIEKYKGYYFLYSQHDMMLNNGYSDGINQIVEINQTSYTIYDSYSRNKKTKFQAKKLKDNSQHNINKLKGEWRSINSQGKTYGNYIPNKDIENGSIALYEGILNLSIKEKSLVFKIDTLQPLESNWKLGKDNRTLVLEYNIDEPYVKGIHVEYADILDLTDTKLKIRLFENDYYTGQEKPKRYLLNLIQEFEKID